MSVHLGAKRGEIAETVLLPGDPLRAKWIAETFLKDTFCYNEVRGMYGYTGTYQGKRVSVQGTGMGVPSTLIYANELIQDYDVKNLIRVGSAGSYQKDVKLRDIVIAMAASSNSAINRHRFRGADYAPTASFSLFKKAIAVAERKSIPVKAGNILTSDTFYADDFYDFRLWAEFGVLCVEMETAGLYTVAAKYNVNALTILTISDSLVSGDRMSAEDRETSFHDMVGIALELV